MADLQRLTLHTESNDFQLRKMFFLEYRVRNASRVNMGAFKAFLVYCQNIKYTAVKGFPSAVAYSMPWTNLVQITPAATQFWQQGRFETKPETEICA